MAKKPDNAYRRRYERLRGRLKAWRRTKIGLGVVPMPLLIPLAEIDDLCCLLADRVQADPDDAALRRDYLAAIAKRQEYVKMLNSLVTEEEPKPNPPQADRLV